MPKFKVGIIGYGFIGKIHLKNLLKFPTIEVLAIFSKLEEKDPISKGIPFFTDYKKMLSEVDLNAVIIGTPTHTHTEIACYCAEKGIDMLLEKPMATNLEGCDKILHSVETYNVKMLLGHVLRFWPSYGSVQKSIINNTLNLGDINYILGKRLQSFPWSKWFEDQKKSGGVVLDLSIHDIDYAMWILGKPNSVTCSAKKIRDVFGESIVKIHFEKNKTAECEASWAKPKDFQFYTYTKIQGTDNHIEFDGAQIYNNDNWNIQNIFTSEDGYYNELEHFLDICINNKKIQVSGNEGREAVKVCIAAIRSAEENGKEIFLDEFD